MGAYPPIQQTLQECWRILKPGLGVVFQLFACSNFVLYFIETIPGTNGVTRRVGLTISLERFDEFQQPFAEEVRKQRGTTELEPKIITDGELTAAELTLELALLLREGGPWGSGFPEPVFDGCG